MTSGAQKPASYRWLAGGSQEEVTRGSGGKTQWVRGDGGVYKSRGAPLLREAFEAGGFS